MNDDTPRVLPFARDLARLPDQIARQIEGEFRVLGSRTYPPLPAGHPAVGSVCATCQRPFHVGDVTTLRLQAVAAAATITMSVLLFHATCAAPGGGT